MSIKEFLGHCFCDSRFSQLRQSIEQNDISFVIEIQRLNNELKRNPKHQELKILIEQRLSL